MRKSAATTASASETRLAARLSGSNHTGRSRSTITSITSGGAGWIQRIQEVTSLPGAAASQSCGKSLKTSSENGSAPICPEKSV